MHRKFLFLAAAAFAMVALAGSASAMTRSSSGIAAASKNAGKVSWAATSHTPFARTKHNKNKITVAQEQDLSPNCGWNINQANCTLAWAVWVGWNPILRGPLLLAYTASGYKYKNDLASVSVDANGITYHIKANARWNYGGKLSPVTGADFIYTVELLNNPNNQVASNTGINQIASAVYNPKHPTTVRFLWKGPGDQALGGGPTSVGCSGANACGPFADYRDLLGSIYPQAALNGTNFNTNMFRNCVCGANGKYITDGPYYMSSYIRGSSVTLKANKKTGGWYGTKPKIATAQFQIITNTTSELQAIKGLEVDVADPQPTPAVGDLVGVKGLTVKFTGGAYLEHIDMNEANTSPAVLRQAYFRHAFMESLDRQGIINAALPYTHGGLTPLDSLLVFQADSRYHAPDHAYNFNAQGAINLLQSNGCTGGPNSPDPNNTNYFTCPQGPAQFTFTYASDNARRVASFQIIQADAKAVGIHIVADPEPTNVMFQNVFAGQYDATEFAWGGSIDPGGFIPIWHCNGDSNVGNSCNSTADGFMDSTLSELNPTQRDIDFVNADAALAQSLPAIPLYALPNVTAYNSLVGGVKPNPAAGFTWNMESWYWKG